MRIAAAALAAVLVLPATSLGWGFEAHKFIADRMIAMLPAQLTPLFEKRRAFIVERAIDPDLWRNVGWDEEPPNHFLDFDYSAYGAYPFENLPREYDAAVRKFGKEVVDEQGTLPWRTAEFYGRLQREFESLKRQPAPTYALDNIALYAAVLVHYVSDGHVPLHAAVNYDGQLTGQNGLHSRWEAELFGRERAKLLIAPAPMAPITDPRTFMFDTLLASNREVANVLAADAAAASGRELYDDAYFAAFSAKALPALEQRLNQSISASAAMIVGAWEQAGKPAVPVELPRTPRTIRRPKP